MHRGTGQQLRWRLVRVSDADWQLSVIIPAVDEAAQSASPSAPRKANQFFARWGRTATDGFGQNEQGRPITLTCPVWRA